ncbi:src-like-adapter 2 [Corythoichthys intestinalis]|uniref:src-like-adapter 2 n=1 Tax=Corythoichthys intestinalis TaxID=161448 RepID=UPI0025A5ED5D|nr:src-like-adapter 2 [Corythoichthys intestinalis]XP_057700955.1 src-like-adapter 2 [Corythoichthys intestinalis]XP_057700956.1 src-like-adapter 2 [Corythoichthys intestinalis]
MGIFPSRFSDNQTVTENTPEPFTSDSEESFTVSLYDFPSFGGTELVMSIGERLTILSDDGNVLMVRSSTTNREMYIPASYTAKVTHRWLFTGISRHKAEELLMRPQNHIGVFLIRQSESKPECFSLSVRWRVNILYSECVKHYLILRHQNGRVFITPKRSFSSLKHLVDYYSEFADGLCCRLNGPCFIRGLDVPRDNRLVLPKVNRRSSNKWKDASRSMILKRRTGSDNSLVSEGLREAISSYLQMTESNNHGWDTS